MQPKKIYEFINDIETVIYTFGKEIKCLHKFHYITEFSIKKSYKYEKQILHEICLQS